MPLVKPVKVETEKDEELIPSHQPGDEKVSEVATLYPKLVDLLLEQQRYAGGGHKVHGFADLFIHQLIEAIEFVLGTISNTASYLRLWALSLAHSQLAEVFFANTMHGAFRNAGLGANVAIIFIGYMVWVQFTVGVLLCMDSMECFLHTLRLHWVEFQNKFYKGTGYQYAPFGFSRLVA